MASRKFRFSRKQTASMAHTCTTCGRDILAGQEYRVSFGGESGSGGHSVRHEKVCPACLAAEAAAEQGKAAERSHAAPGVGAQKRAPSPSGLVWVEGRGWVRRSAVK